MPIAGERTRSVNNSTDIPLLPFRVNHALNNTMADTAAFPQIKAKPHLQLKEDLPGQIYTIDGFLSDAEQANVLRWAQMTTMKDSTKPGKGEAERTARECNCLRIAAIYRVTAGPCGMHQLSF